MSTPPSMDVDTAIDAEAFACLNFHVDEAVIDPTCTVASVVAPHSSNHDRFLDNPSFSRTATICHGSVHRLHHHPQIHLIPPILQIPTLVVQ